MREQGIQWRHRPRWFLRLKWRIRKIARHKDSFPASESEEDRQWHAATERLTAERWAEEESTPARGLDS